MSRPNKYNTEAERLEARREQHKRYNKKRKVSKDNSKTPNDSHKVSNDNNDNNCYGPNDNNDNNYNVKDTKEYKELRAKYKALLHESEITNEYCKELEEQLAEAKEMGY